MPSRTQMKQALIAGVNVLRVLTVLWIQTVRMDSATLSQISVQVIITFVIVKFAKNYWDRIGIVVLCLPFLLCTVPCCSNGFQNHNEADGDC